MFFKIIQFTFIVAGFALGTRKKITDIKPEYFIRVLTGTDLKK